MNKCRRNTQVRLDDFSSQSRWLAVSHLLLEENPRRPSVNLVTWYVLTTLKREPRRKRGRRYSITLKHRFGNVVQTMNFFSISTQMLNQAAGIRSRGDFASSLVIAGLPCPKKNPL